MALAAATALCGAVLIGAAPAQAGPLDLAAPLLGPCPLFPGPGDPVYCSAALPPPAADTPAPPVLQVPPAAVVEVVPDIAWRDIDPYAIVFPAGALPELSPVSRLSGIDAAGDGLGLTVSRSDDTSNLLSAAYDVPVRGDLQQIGRASCRERVCQYV